jgi:CarD family transcriptional regulator
VTEKKNMRAASPSPATTAKTAAAAQTAGAAGADLAAAPKASGDKSAAARASSAAVARAAAASPAGLVAAASKPPAAKPASESKAVASKPGTHRTGFKTNEFIVYPAHGVGQIIAIEEQEVAGFKLELFVINFVKDKMTLKVPLPKVLNGAIRKLAEPETAKKSLDTLTGRARIKRTMWSRRAQEYEAKINSGDLIAIAEVVRDLYRSDAQPEQSYSERQLYEAALDRMAREIAAVQRLTEIEALKVIDAHLQRGPRRGARGDATADEPAEEGDIEEAA